MKPGKPAVRNWVIGILGLVLSVPVVAATAHTNPMNYDPQVRAAYERFYNLDYPGAVARFEQFHAGPSRRPAGHRLSAQRADLSGTLPAGPARHHLLRQRRLSHRPPRHRRGPRKARPASSPWPTRRCARPTGASSRNPNDVDALFARAWVRSLRCTYVAMVERAFGAGFRLATKAKDDAERALQIDPDYVDAKLIAGVYEYVVGALPWPFKLHDRLCRHHRLQIHRTRHARRRRQARRHHQCRSRAPPSRSSCAANPGTRKPSRWCAA